MGKKMRLLLKLLVAQALLQNATSTTQMQEISFGFNIQTFPLSLLLVHFELLLCEESKKYLEKSASYLFLAIAGPRCY